MPLGLTAAGTDAGFKKKYGSGSNNPRVFGLGCPLNLTQWVTTLIFSNEEMKAIIKIINSLEDSDLLIKGVTQSIENEPKDQKKWVPWYFSRYIRR